MTLEPEFGRVVLVTDVVAAVSALLSAVAAVAAWRAAKQANLLGERAERSALQAATLTSVLACRTALRSSWAGLPEEHRARLLRSNWRSRGAQSAEGQAVRALEALEIMGQQMQHGLLDMQIVLEIEQYVGREYPYLLKILPSLRTALNDDGAFGSAEAYLACLYEAQTAEGKRAAAELLAAREAAAPSATVGFVV